MLRGSNYGWLKIHQETGFVGPDVNLYFMRYIIWQRVERLEVVSIAVVVVLVVADHFYIALFSSLEQTHCRRSFGM